MTLSHAAITAGSNPKIKMVEHKVPCDIVVQILAVIAEAKWPTIRVTITKIDADVNIV